MERTKRKSCIWIIASFVGFISLWYCWIRINKLYLFGDLIEGLLGFGDLIWLASGAFLIAINRNRLDIRPIKMFATAPKMKILLPSLAIIVVYYIGSMFLNRGGFYINPNRNILCLIVMFIIVALQEELLFRGWFQNILATVTSERKANLISAFLFMLIHYPGWILAGVASTSFIILSISTFVLGIVFGWSFRKSRSLWTPIILHMVWDVFSYLV